MHSPTLPQPGRVVLMPHSTVDQMVPVPSVSIDGVDDSISHYCQLSDVQLNMFNRVEMNDRELQT